MKPIIRALGVTESERYLASLADRTFLDLWSYPNTFMDKNAKNGGDGKELCDLLVVCGDDVIIFSDKSISWPEHEDLNVTWARWYRRAVKKSVDQIRGAERWLGKFPTRIFIDRRCTQPLPIALPPPERVRIHGVVIALGADSACKVFFGGGDGSLMVLGPLKGDDHVNADAKAYMPFAIGDVDPDGSFVHVFDKSALNLLFTELDTISDFTRYLVEREKFIRGGRVGIAPGEAELLGLYLQYIDSRGDHRFPTPSDFGTTDDYKISVLEGDLGALASEEYKAYKESNQVSYVWDRLIGVFTENILAGTSVAIAGEAPSAKRAEPALRIMARESRAVRGALGTAFSEGLKLAESARQDRFARVVLPTAGSADPECGYVFLVLAYPTKFELEEGYEQYRQARVAILETYCATVLYERRDLKRMVGIALDASSRVTGREGGSEDLLAYEIDEWDAGLETVIRDRRAQYEVLDAKRVQLKRMSIGEDRPSLYAPTLTREQIKAAEKRARRAEKRSRHLKR